MSITVREILKMEPFTSCQLIAGEGGLSNIVKYTTTMEMPDIRTWLNQDLLLITTGYAIRNNPGALVKLVEDLADVGCAGLLIKKEYIGYVPQKAISLSNRLNIPLIIFPDHLPFNALFVPLMKAISQDQNAQIQNSRLFMDMIAAHSMDSQALPLRAEALGWPKPPLRVIILELEEQTEITEQIHEAVSGQLSALHAGSLTMFSGHSLTLLVSSGNSTEGLTTCLEEIIETIRTRFSLTARAGISAPVTTYSQIRQAYADAKDALQIGKILKKESFLHAIEDCRLEQSFFQFRGNTQLKEYLQTTLGAVAAYDRENGTELMKTLQELIGCMGVKTKTAEKLFLHRNTLQYRIHKIEELTGMNLSDSETLLRLAMMLKIKPFL
ncbi:MAG: PucR family transcriptional regulator ligand-binding domain-containing protein [Firmicutes bacterium]|nr:PucR family transcriptional regulator ligand-binding domain-containing protein [Bacillota bacterium]